MKPAPAHYLWSGCTRPSAETTDFMSHDTTETATQTRPVCVCVCVHTLMLSTARWQHAARTEQPSWKYHSASSLQTLCSRLDRENSRRSEVRVLRWRRGGTACLLPLVLYGVHVVSCVVDRGGLRGTNVSFTCSLEKTIFSLLYSSLNLTKRYLIYCKKKKMFVQCFTKLTRPTKPFKCPNPCKCGDMAATDHSQK